MRLYDAFQAGSIPVTVGTPFFFSLLPQPVPVVRLVSWDEAGTRLKTLARDEAAVTRLHRDSALFFARVEGEAALRMRAVLDALIGD
jgi:hypothetical protein